MPSKASRSKDRHPSKLRLSPPRSPKIPISDILRVKTINQSSRYVACPSNRKMERRRTNMMQNMELGNFANFPEPTSRATSHFIDPSYLTGHGIPNTQRDQYDGRTAHPSLGSELLTKIHTVSQRIQQSQAPAVSTPPPVMSISGNSHDFASTAIKTNDSGTPQIQQPMLQSKFLAVDLSQQHGMLTITHGEVFANPLIGLAIQPKVAKLSAKPRKPKDPNAPKRAVGRPRKEGASARPRPDGKSPASSYDSDSDELEIEEMAEPAPLILSSGPPNDLEGKAIYDTIQAVWSPRNKAAVPDRIRAGIALFGETIRKLRDVWKTKNAALQQAENTNSTAVPSIKEEVARYRRLMEKVTRMAVEFGHEAHLTKYVCTLPPPSSYVRHASVGVELFLADFQSRHVHVEMKSQAIFHRLNECHNKGLAISPDCLKARNGPVCFQFMDSESYSLSPPGRGVRYSQDQGACRWNFHAFQLWPPYVAPP